ncbi:type II toxin-antitoxin system RelE/ParE family toxin [Candidatus Woesearchaeota archaeon]|nr:type II toxin-antitoxin system RelE/ParE family toxin [Candidatus Woesearchaeota archaeon]
MYELHFDEKVLQYLEKLPKEISKRIFKKLQETKENPHHYFVKLSNRSEYKLRVGDYRVIADIEDNKLVIYVIHADHRRSVYKKW